MDIPDDVDARFRRAKHARYGALARRARAREAYLIAQEHYAQALAVFDELLTQRADDARGAIPDGIVTRRKAR